jgi:hypothetical protein
LRAFIASIVFIEVVLWILLCTRLPIKCQCSSAYSHLILNICLVQEGWPSGNGVVPIAAQAHGEVVVGNDDEDWVKGLYDMEGMK